MSTEPLLLDFGSMRGSTGCKWQFRSPSQ